MTICKFCENTEFDCIDGAYYCKVCQNETQVLIFNSRIFLIFIKRLKILYNIIYELYI